MTPTCMPKQKMAYKPVMPFSQWPRLANATAEERRDFYLSYGGIHWPQLDEDLSFEGLFQDNGILLVAEDTPEYNTNR